MKLFNAICRLVVAVATALPKAVAVIAPAFKGKRPDITPAMVVAVVKFVCVQAVAVGLMKAGTQAYIVQITGTVASVAIMVLDFGLRSARNKADLASVFMPPHAEG